MNTNTLPAVQQTGTMGNPEHPLDYPTMMPSALSEDAQMVYENSARLFRNVDVDLLDPKAHLRYVSEADRNKFEPSQRVLAAIAELEEARIATYRPDSRSLVVTRAPSATPSLPVAGRR